MQGFARATDVRNADLISAALRATQQTKAKQTSADVSDSTMPDGTKHAERARMGLGAFCGRINPYNASNATPRVFLMRAI